MGEMVKKWKIAPFLNTAVGSDGLVNKSAPVWMRVKKSTSFDLNMNPETEEYDYIADENPTTELKKYKPSFNTPLTMYKGEPDYEFVFGKFYDLAVGSDAKTEVLLVFFQETLDDADVHKVFRAWRSDCVLSVNDLNSVDSTLTFDVNFGGTVKKGYATVTGTGEDATVSFTEGTYTATASGGTGGTDPDPDPDPSDPGNGD